ncbi:replication-associated recombination protein A [Desulfurobacterium atlanticum]|uniref:Replication-associated recombination protein A n=1 Tax=Desulfurobacterium atlanticum TaxID=240169 RepID=A0A238ZB86_9BACT|nr:replication-associated recombination protein A [Desulfurobacterium atlanticum]SNR80238.1 putative ATPase [Desulfurobacterium atlanticum]
METLFSKGKRPLPYRLQPETLDEFIGQSHILGKGKPLRNLIEKDAVKSSVFWGEPGTGKTTLARLIAKLSRAEFIEINAVTSNIKEIKEALKRGKANFELGKKTILFIDEIHRFNKIQQDALLPDIEAGNVILVGASTENPYFSLVPALRSRVKLYKFNPLSVKEIKKLLRWALTDRRGLRDKKLKISEENLELIARLSGGDGRKALNFLEEIASLVPVGAEITREIIEEVAYGETTGYGKGDYHYDIISAFIKSVRGSDVDAALYYLARMLKGGEDPMFIARRLVILASEDIGNANPEALLISNAAMNIVSKIGMPEAALTLAQATIYLAMSPKSNAVYRSIGKALEAVESGDILPVPLHLKDSHYEGAKKLNHGKGYLYPHNFPRHYVKQKYLSEDRKFYTDDGIGFEKQLKIWLKEMMEDENNG